MIVEGRGVGAVCCLSGGFEARGHFFNLFPAVAEHDAAGEGGSVSDVRVVA